MLKLPFNTLTDDAMSGLVKLMNEKCHVRVLDLTNNKSVKKTKKLILVYMYISKKPYKLQTHIVYRISDQGAKHLASYLESGVKIRLETLLLGLNVIGDDGCLLLANVI